MARMSHFGHPNAGDHVVVLMHDFSLGDESAFDASYYIGFHVFSFFIDPIISPRSSRAKINTARNFSMPEEPNLPPDDTETPEQGPEGRKQH
tara:strand:- start:887 stop:1162 length:276 start_codon:yes stop_codon:yes gene_type:complete